VNCVKPRVGDLIRWIIDYAGFEAGETSADVRPFNPIYEYGIVLDISSQDPNAVIVSIMSCGQLHVLHMIQDGFEIVSAG
tara:strand:- start:758 stop:997 length:240 start_codon:yes stop_codon:yes gene_type:complete